MADHVQGFYYASIEIGTHPNALLMRLRWLRILI